MIFDIASIVLGAAAILIPLIRIIFKKGGPTMLWLSYALAFCAMILQFFEILSLTEAGYFLTIAQTIFVRGLCAVGGCFLVLLLQLFAAPHGRTGKRAAEPQNDDQQ